MDDQLLANGPYHSCLTREALRVVGYLEFLLISKHWRKEYNHHRGPHRVDE